MSEASHGFHSFLVNFLVENLIEPDLIKQRNLKIRAFVGRNPIASPGDWIRNPSAANHLRRLIFDRGWFDQNRVENRTHSDDENSLPIWECRLTNAVDQVSESDQLIPG